MDVRGYNQYPDLPLFHGNSNVIIKDNLIFFDDEKEIPTSLYEYFVNKIYTKEKLFKNRGLCEAIIKYTKSFVILENIPIERIEIV